MAFYRRDVYGIDLFSLNYVARRVDEESATVYSVFQSSEEYRTLVESALAQKDHVLYVHHASAVGSVAPLEQTVQTLQTLGFVEVQRVAWMPITPFFARASRMYTIPDDRSATEETRYRITLLAFERVRSSVINELPVH